MEHGRAGSCRQAWRRGRNPEAHKQRDQSTTGQIFVAVFADEGSYEASSSTAAVFEGCATFERLPLRIFGLAEGSHYGIRLFHDENSNSLLETKRILGQEVPAEGFGFSNNPEIGFGAPSWQQVRFLFGPGLSGHEIALRYF